MTKKAKVIAVVRRCFLAVFRIWCNMFLLVAANFLWKEIAVYLELILPDTGWLLYPLRLSS